MPITLQDAVDSLYEIAVTQKAATSTLRLQRLADYCAQELTERGLPSVLAEQVVPGGGRPKAWDVAWMYDSKYRLAISLKSLLKNLSGTVPNRIDDLMGEAANVQIHSPEIVTGYLMILDIGSDAHSAKHGSTWSALLRSRLSNLSGRRPPAWTIGTVEAFAMLEVDFSKSPGILSGADLIPAFFDVLVEQVRFRNPGAFPIKPTPAEQDPLAGA
jgi:hypothetical protein